MVAPTIQPEPLPRAPAGAADRNRAGLYPTLFRGKGEEGERVHSLGKGNGARSPELIETQRESGGGLFTLLQG